MGCDNYHYLISAYGEFEDAEPFPMGSTDEDMLFRGEERIARTAMPGAPKMFPGWFSSLAQQNLRDCLAAAGSRSATDNL